MVVQVITQTILAAFWARAPVANHPAETQAAPSRGEKDDAMRDVQEPRAPYRVAEDRNDGKQWRHGERVADGQRHFRGEIHLCEGAGEMIHANLRPLVSRGKARMRDGSSATAREYSTKRLKAFHIVLSWY